MLVTKQALTAVWERSVNSDGTVRLSLNPDDSFAQTVHPSGGFFPPQLPCLSWE